MRVFPLFAAVLFTACSLAAAHADQENCKLEEAADLPVTWVDNHPAVTVKLAGQTALMLFDTGAETSLLSDAAFDKLGLTNTIQLTGGYMNLPGGTEQVIGATSQDLDFGQYTLKETVFVLMKTINGGQSAFKNIDGILGYDVLQYFDIALDLPHSRIQLFEPEHCNPPQTPWPGSFAPVQEIHPRSEESPYLPVTVDGQEIDVLLDTGAGEGDLSAAALAHAGVKPEAIASKGGAGTDMAGDSFRLRKEEFADYEVGAEDYSDMWLPVDQTVSHADSLPPGGLLGEDYLTGHRVFISNATSTILLGLTGQ